MFLKVILIWKTIGYKQAKCEVCFGIFNLKLELRSAFGFLTWNWSIKEIKVRYAEFIDFTEKNLGYCPCELK